MNGIKISLASKKLILKKLKEIPAGKKILKGKLINGELKGLKLVFTGSDRELDEKKFKDIQAGNIFIVHHPDGDLSPTPAEIRFASSLKETGAGLIIVDSQINDIEVILMPEEPEFVSREEISEFFTPGGLLNKHFRGYEFRNQQVEMAEAIRRAFKKNRHLLVEAGTGTGKTFAYLVPSLLFSLRTGEKIVVSTNTINLQEQLVEHDLPDLLSAMGKPELKTVLVKGRGNYLCIRRIEHQLQWNRDKRSINERQVLVSVFNKMQNLSDGTRQELNFNVPVKVWDDINSRKELCLGRKCPFFNKCFFQKARNKIQDGEIFIVNHHLLFSDLILKKEGEEGGGILPQYDYLIIDEAHNIEEVATEYFGYSIIENEVKRNFKRMFERKRNSGFLTELRKILANKGDRENLPLIDNMCLKVLKSEEIFDSLLVILGEKQELKNGEKKRFLEGFYSSDILINKLKPLIKSFLNEGKKLKEGFKKLTRILGTFDLDQNEEMLLLETKIHRDFLVALENALEFILLNYHPGFVAWMERSNSGLSLQARPIQISSYLQEFLFGIFNSVILTSATLTVKNSFSFFRESLGLDHLQVDEIQIGSPYDFKNQSLLQVIKDLPEFHQERFLDEAVIVVKQIIEMLEGKAMILFTSYQMLEGFARRFSVLLSEDYSIYSQGELSRSKIIKRFKKEEKAVILGTSSFWEGVDVKGDDLQSVILVKLPFSVPDDPVIEAKCEALKKEGKNPFWDYSLPKAVIKFRQGFGRLIRSKDDRGIVVVLDSRIVKKSYGKTFLTSLPEGTPVVINSRSDFLPGLKKFILKTS